MRYVLHHSEAVFNETSKRWIFTLDRRIANPRSVRLSKCVFTASTATTYPSVVYMRSDAIHSMIKTKHTVELKANNHENSSNIIAVLEETHTQGRYAIAEKGLPLPVHGHSHVREIDIYFTDGATVMDGVLSSGSSSGGSSEADDSTIAAFGSDLAVWVNMDYAPLSASTALVTTIGDNVSYLRAKPPASASLLLVSNNATGFELAEFGLTRAVVGSGSWVQMHDSGGIALDLTCSLHFMFRAPPTTAAQQLIRFKDMWAINWSNNQIQFLSKWPGHPQGGTMEVITATNFFVNTDWYVECTHSDPDGDGIPAYNWRFIDLNDANAPNYGEILETTTGSDFPLNTNHYIQLSNASDHYSAHMSHIIVLNTGGPTKRDTIRDWMIAKYGVADPEPGTPAPVVESDSFFIELDIDT